MENLGLLLLAVAVAASGCIHTGSSSRGKTAPIYISTGTPAGGLDSIYLDVGEERDFRLFLLTLKEDWCKSNGDRCSEFESLEGKHDVELILKGRNMSFDNRTLWTGDLEYGMVKRINFSVTPEKIPTKLSLQVKITPPSDDRVDIDGRFRRSKVLVKP